MTVTIGVTAALASAIMFGGAPATDANRVKMELLALRGTWKLVDIEIAGNRMTDEATRNKSLAVFDGDRLTRLSDGGFFTYKIKITPGKQFIAIDLLGIEAGKEIKTLAIYEIKGDTLRLCTVQRTGADRPTGFRTSADPDAPEHAWVVSIFRRQSKN